MKPNVSSRTPDGPAGRCPVCGEVFCLNPSLGLSDAPCPCCGQLVFPIIDVNGTEARLALLTAREKEIHERRCDGESTEEIARALFIDTRTVLTHLAHIEEKLHGRM